MFNDKFIIPQNRSSIIAKLENNLIIEIDKIDVPYYSKNVFLKNRRFVVLCFNKKLHPMKLKVFDEYGTQIFTKTKYKFTAINHQDNIVYLGGQHRENRKEIFSFIDLHDINLNINKINIPVNTFEGKSIDDILIRNKTLYLVDNMTFPKYVFKYDISKKDNPINIGIYELKNNGTYEHIIKGDINNNWIILFSSSHNHGVSFQHISIIEDEEKWNNQRTLHFCIDGSGGWHKEDSKIVFDVCIINDKLYILKEDGLYYINLLDKITVKNIVKINNNLDKYDKLIKIDNNNCIVLNSEKYEHIIN